LEPNQNCPLAIAETKIFSSYAAHHQGVDGMNFSAIVPWGGALAWEF